MKMAENGNGDGDGDGESCWSCNGRSQGDQMRAGASLRASYTWIRRVSILRPTSYTKYAPTPILTFFSCLRSTLQTLQTLQACFACFSPCHFMQSSKVAPAYYCG